MDERVSKEDVKLFLSREREGVFPGTIYNKIEHPMIVKAK